MSQSVKKEKDDASERQKAFFNLGISLGRLVEVKGSKAGIERGRLEAFIYIRERLKEKGFSSQEITDILGFSIDSIDY